MSMWEKYKKWIIGGSIAFLIAIIITVILVVIFVVKPTSSPNKTSITEEDKQNNDLPFSTTNTQPEPPGQTKTASETISAKDLLQPGSIVHSLAQTPPNPEVWIKSTDNEPPAQELLQQQIQTEVIIHQSHKNTEEQQQQQQDATSITLEDHLIESVALLQLGSESDSSHIVDRLDAFKLPSHVTVSRLKPQDKTSHQLSHYMAHLYALSHAMKQIRNGSLSHTLMIQDNAPHFIDPYVLKQFLFYADKCTSGRWDVISFVPAQHGEFLQQIPVNYSEDGKHLPPAGLFRITEPRDTRWCYLVNKHYLTTLCHYMWDTLRSISKAVHTQATSQNQILDEVFNMNKPMFDLQKRDCWLAFTIPLLSEQKLFYPVTRVSLLSPHKAYRVAVTFHVLAASEPEAQKQLEQLQDTIKHFYLRFLKLHMVEFYIFTNYPQLLPALTTIHGTLQSVIVVDNDTWCANPSLYKFHILSIAATRLQHYDYVFHSSYYHMAIMNPPHESQLLIEDGVTCTEYPLTAIHDHKQSSLNALLPPLETAQNKSTAYIPPTETIRTRFSTSFFGGKSVPFLTLCESIRAMIDSDVKNQWVSAGQDTAYFQRYLMEHPPATVLPAGYQFYPSCFDSRNSSQLCDAVRASDSIPIFVPLSPRSP